MRSVSGDGTLVSTFIVTVDRWVIALACAKEAELIALVHKEHKRIFRQRFRIVVFLHELGRISLKKNEVLIQEV